MKFLSYIQEKLTLQQIREYVPRNWNKKRYNDIFKGKYRLYLELEKTEETDIEPLLLVKNLLYKNGYKIINYKAGLCSKENDDRPIRIGKVINSLKLHGKAKETCDIALKEFKSDPRRQVGNTKDLMIVISRHPYDIAGMSTDRGWTSCMNLKTGCNKGYVPREIKTGTLVAYLIKKSDPNIEKPIARLLLKPYIDDTGTIYLGIDAAVYGTAAAGFKETVEKWLNSVQSDKTGIFTLSTDVYRDADLKDIIVKGEFTFEELITRSAAEISLIGTKMIQNWNKLSNKTRKSLEHAFEDYNMFEILKGINYDSNKCDAIITIASNYSAYILKRTLFPVNLKTIYRFIIIINNRGRHFLKMANASMTTENELKKFIKVMFKEYYGGDLDDECIEKIFPYAVDALKLKVSK